MVTEFLSGFKSASKKVQLTVKNSKNWRETFIIVFCEPYHAAAASGLLAVWPLNSQLHSASSSRRSLPPPDDSFPENTAEITTPVHRFSMVAGLSWSIPSPAVFLPITRGCSPSTDHVLRREEKSQIYKNVLLAKIRFDFSLKKIKFKLFFFN